MLLIHVEMGHCRISLAVIFVLLASRERDFPSSRVTHMFSRISRSVALGVQRDRACTIDRGRSGKSRSSFTNGALLPSNNKLQTGVALKKKRGSRGFARVHRFPASLDHCSPRSGLPLCILCAYERGSAGASRPAYCARKFVSVTRCKVICGCTLPCSVSHYVSIRRARHNGIFFFFNVDSTPRESETRQLRVLPVSRNRVVKPR